MKRLILIFGLFVIFGCAGKTATNNGKTYEEIDSTYEYPYKEGGVYRKIIRKYKYGNNWHKHEYQIKTIDETHYIGYLINEYKDTMEIKYINTVDFPRREE